MTWSLELLPEAEEDFDSLPAEVQQRIVVCLQELQEDPHRPGTRQLAGNLRGCCRARVGDYRVGNCLDEQSGLISVWAIGHRSKFYKVAERREKQ
jgi:mRNA-degrading endonuclease RelE of RelBE toxin-antitoxin system